MAKPSDKSPDVNKFLDNVAEQLFGNNRTTSIENDICVICCKMATEFKDEISRKEYTISGMCQACQDETFKP